MKQYDAQPKNLKMPKEALSNYNYLNSQISGTAVI